MTDRYIFWITNPSVLYRNDNYLSFFPTNQMNRVEQLNAITRFMIYLIILCVVVKKSKYWIQIPMMIIIFCIFLYYVFVSDKKGIERENFEDRTTDPTNPKSNKAIKRVRFESGYYDSDGKLQIDEFVGSKNSNKKTKNPYLIKQYTKSILRKPTSDNPFMNPTANEFNTEDPPNPSNVDDEEISNKITESFNEDLYRDIEDMYEKYNSQRQFYTIPTPSIPPDTVALAKWLYRGQEQPCKVNQSNCLKYEDIRYKRDNAIPSTTYIR
jgi:hypothetical protein